MNLINKIILMGMVATFMGFGSGMAYASEGEAEVVIAEETGLLAMQAGQEDGFFLLVGFDSEPLVLDVSDTKAPVLLTGYSILDIGSELAAYVSLTADSSVFASGLNQVVEISFIEVLN